jgi:hypothetical protein
MRQRMENLICYDRTIALLQEIDDGLLIISVDKKKYSRFFSFFVFAISYQLIASKMKKKANQKKPA